MGLLDFLTGSRPAPRGVARVPRAALRTELLALNRPTMPWQVRDGGKGDYCDIVAEWKIVDAAWYEIFAKAGMTRIFRIRMKVDEPKGELRVQDQEWTVEWRAGVPHMRMSVELVQGRKEEISFGAGFVFKETLASGKVYEYRFNTAEMKKPLQEVVARCGWRWRGILFNRL